MIRHLYCSVLLVIIFNTTASINAQTAKDISDSGNRFLEICSSIEKPSGQVNELDLLNSGACTGFMLGLGDGVALSIQMLKHNDNSLSYLKGSMEDLAICIPSDVEVGQLIRVVLKYIREHPEEAHLRSAELVVLAEFNAFPCEKPKK